MSRNAIESQEGTDIQEREWEQVHALCERYPVVDGREMELPHLATSSAV